MLSGCGEVVGEVALHSPSGFGHVLFDEIGRFLSSCGVQLREIDCFASAAGPGSFTGLRVGLSCVKGLA
jgi:tRNA threonylcarbamoyladenosine biosynthesis protein TsaB